MSRACASFCRYFVTAVETHVLGTLPGPSAQNTCTAVSAQLAPKPFVRGHICGHAHAPSCIVLFAFFPFAGCPLNHISGCWRPVQLRTRWCMPDLTRPPTVASPSTNAQYCCKFQMRICCQLQTAGKRCMCEKVLLLCRFKVFTAIM